MTTEAQAPVVQIIYPEEPESYINVNGKLRRFQYGQLVGEVSQSDIEFFDAMNMRAGREKYIIAVDGLAPDQYSNLYDRAMVVCAKKAWASDPLKIAEDVKLFIAGATNRGAAEPVAPPMRYESLVAKVQGVVPSILQHQGISREVAVEQHQRADEVAIQQGLNGGGYSDTPQPDNTVTDPTEAQGTKPAAPVWPVGNN